MKEYKLSAWPDLPAPYQRAAHRRMVCDMSHRYVTVQQLMNTSGAGRLEVRMFLQMLSERGLLVERDVQQGPFSSAGGLGEWLRRAFHGDDLRER